MGMRLPRSELHQPGSGTAPGLTMLGRSAAMNRVLAAVTRVSGTDFSVLITGESGSGKELVARAVHEQSERRTGPFVAVSCGSLSFETSGADLLERARRGTLYLDEISDMPADLQIRLLRLLEQRDSGRVGGTTELYADSRIIASTTRDPSRDGTHRRPGGRRRQAACRRDRRRCGRCEISSRRGRPRPCRWSA